MLNRKVYGVCGPGEAPKEGFASLEGTIVSESMTQYRENWTVEWTKGELAGRTEIIWRLKKAGVDTGIGVYLAEDS